MNGHMPTPTTSKPSETAGVSLVASMSPFSSFAIAMATICILSGGITSFPQGFCGVGGAAIGLGWPLCFLFTMAVALTMAQTASAFPTAGGAYHWSTILGGRSWGWATACFAIAGLVTALAAVNVGACLFLLRIVGRPYQLDLNTFPFDYLVPALGAILMTAIQALVNHFGIRLTTRLTDLSGYLIMALVAVLIGSLLLFGVILPHQFEPGRLVDLSSNFSGQAGGGVWPETGNILWLFLLGLLLPAYTLTGFDAAAQTSEETLDAPRVVPRGIVQAVVISGLAGWVVLCCVILATPNIAEAAATGDQCFFHIIDTVIRLDWLRFTLYGGIFVVQFLCGLATLTSVSRMLYAFARDGGPPGSRWLRRLSPERRTPSAAIWTIATLGAVCALLPYAAVAAVCAIFLYIAYVVPTGLGLLAHGRRWTKFGPWHIGPLYKPLAAVCIAGCVGVLVIGIQPPNEIAIPVIGGFTLALAAIWWCHKRRHFPGPPAAILLMRESEAAVSLEGR